MKRWLTILLALMVVMVAKASDYKLYFSLGLSAPAGTCSITESTSMYNGTPAKRVRMVMQTSGMVGAFYSLNDTITSYIDNAGRSIYYSKAVHEGSKDVLETAEFLQQNSVRLTIAKRGEKPYTKTVSSGEQIYDMLSLMKYAETLGNKIPAASNRSTASTVPMFSVPMVNGNQVVQQNIHFTGKKSVADAKGKRHDCVVYSVRDFKNGPERETLRIYITDDSKHTPVRLDIVLGQSYIKALLEK